MRRRIRHGIKVGTTEGNNNIVAIWMLRLLIENNWMLRAVYSPKNGYQDDDIQEFLGLPEFDTKNKKPLKKVRALMTSRLEKLSAMKSTEQVVEQNIKLLSSRFELTEVQKLMLLYAVLTENSSVWQDLFRFVNIQHANGFIQVLSCALDVSSKEIKSELAKKSFFRQSGILTLSKDSFTEGKLEMMDSLEDALLADNENQEDLFSHFLVPARKANLEMSDYPHVTKDVQLMEDIIRKAISKKDKGVNLMVYGTPGTGKTELARLLADQLNLSMFEVKTEDDDGDTIRGSQRLDSYRLSQQLLADDSKSLILFDEVEDVFPAKAFSFFGMQVRSGENKGWMNKTLEENKTPAIWVCNQVQQIDPAFLRRFDYVMELNTPPKSVRLKIVNSYLGAMPVSDSFKQRLAEHSQISPAQVAKVSKVAARMRDDKTCMDDVLESVVDNSLKAMSLKLLPKKNKHATKYDLSYLQTNTDISRMIEGLGRSKKGNLCFYGAPGTGKTALAGYIAESLEIPLVSKKASDILGMYVGESEQNIAAMFKEAKQEKAVLVLDEADSLLRDRRGANRSWEVSQVNELLVQMENFDGIFICSTNLMDNLDQASLRRFALKVEFNYLSSDQALRMLKQESVGSVDENSKRMIMSMDCLAPGDFAAVNKRLEILGLEATPDVMVKELQEEMEVKSDYKTSKPIGFTN